MNMIIISCPVKFLQRLHIFWHFIILCFYCVIEKFQSVKGWLLYKDAIKCFESKISSSACEYWYHTYTPPLMSPVPEFIEPVFTKTSSKRRAFWLVSAKTGSIILGTDFSLFFKDSKLSVKWMWGGGVHLKQHGSISVCFLLFRPLKKIHPRVVRSDFKLMSKHVQLATEHYVTVVPVACECRCSSP